jgi:hypothetical protein
LKYFDACKLSVEQEKVVLKLMESHTLETFNEQEMNTAHGNN